MSREVIEFAIKLNEFLTDVPIEETFIWELVSQNQSEILDRIIHKKKPWMIVQGYNINSLVDDRYPDDIYITLEEPHDVECLVKDGWNDNEELTEFDLFQKNKHKLSANSVFVCKLEDYAKGDYDDSIYDRTGNWFQPRNIDEAVENSQFIEDYTVQLSYVVDGCMKITKYEFGLCYKQYETLEHWFKKPLADKFEDDNFNRNCVRLEMSGFGKYKDIKQIMNKRMTPSDIYLYIWEKQFGPISNYLDRFKTMEQDHKEEVTKLKKEHSFDILVTRVNYNNRIHELETELKQTKCNLHNQIVAETNLYNYEHRKWCEMADQIDKLASENVSLIKENNKLRDQLKTVFAIKDDL